MKFRQLDLNHLHLLDVLYDQRSVSRTASILKVTQPAVSLALNKLRDHFGDPLFIRNGSGLVPTAFAEALHGPVRRVIRSIEEDICQLRNFVPEVSQRTFHVSTSDIGEVLLMPQILRLLREQTGHCDAVSLSLPPRLLADAMERGEIDIAIGYFPDLERNGFHRHLMGEGKLVCIVCKSCAQIGERMELEQFEMADHAIVTHESRELDEYEALIVKLGLRRRVRTRIAHMISMPAIVAETDLVAVVPDAVGLLSSKIRIVELPFETEALPIAIYWHHRTHKETANQWFRDNVAKKLVLNTTTHAEK